MDIERKRFRLSVGCRAAVVRPGTASQWRLRYGFPGHDLLSILDIAVLVLVGTMVRRGFNTPDAIKWVEQHGRPALRKALRHLLTLGRKPPLTKAQLEQEPINGLAAIKVTYDLAAIAEHVCTSLELRVPEPRPSTAEAKQYLALMLSADFRERLSMLKREIDKRKPRTWTWLDVETATGLPEWFALWALQQPRHRARKQIERVRDELPEVRP